MDLEKAIEGGHQQREFMGRVLNLVEQVEQAEIEAERMRTEVEESQQNLHMFVKAVCTLSSDEEICSLIDIDDIHLGDDEVSAPIQITENLEGSGSAAYIQFERYPTNNVLAFKLYMGAPIAADTVSKVPEKELIGLTRIGRALNGNTIYGKEVGDERVSTRIPAKITTLSVAEALQSQVFSEHLAVKGIVDRVQQVLSKEHGLNEVDIAVDRYPADIFDITIQDDGSVVRNTTRKVK